jgi:hypothetical protein
MSRAIPIDVYNKNGNMLRIEFYDGKGDHIIDAIWDPTDEQTSENRIKFRKWAYMMLSNKGFRLYN